MRVKSIIGSSIGNILEWYDFGLFAIYSALFSELFFPSSNPHVAILTTFSVFAVGFICRPIGALLFGFIGDRDGRVKALRLSILMISLPTLLIGCLPTYATAGMLAPVLLTLIRIWQGISLGGEYSGNLIYLAESAPKQYRATVTALAGTGANLGILLATMVGGITSYLFSDETFHAWGWRLPYLISGILCIFIYLTRVKMKETSVFIKLKSKELVVKNPIKTVLKSNLPEVFRTLGLVCMGSTFYYFCFVYLPVLFAQTKQFSLFKTANYVAILMATMLILVPLAGRLCDYVGYRKILLFNSALIASITIPGFYWLQQDYFFGMLIVMAIFTVASSLEQGTTSIAVVENFPLPARYTGLSLGYNIGNGIFGGTIPFICQWLVLKTQVTLAPAFYITGCALITGAVALFFTKNSR